MKKLIPLVSLFVMLGFLSAFTPAQPTAMQLINRMLAAGREIQTLKFTLHKQERINGKLAAEKTAVKLQVKPFKVYLKYLTPSAGMEVLYVTGQNNNQAWVKPASFPWTTISLDPTGSTMRAGQRHVLTEMGLNQILSQTEVVQQKYGEQANAMLKLNGTVTWDDLPCYQVTLENPNFKYVTYTVGKNENLVGIARKFKLSEYLILEKNPEIDDYNDVSAGQKIKLPSDYARKITMLLDQKTGLPVVVKVYDDAGLFEQFEYHNLQVNPPLKEMEFTRTYPDYKF